MKTFDERVVSGMRKGRLRTFFLPLALLTLVGCSTPRLQPREGYVAVPGGRVWFKVVGTGLGTPLLLLHGGPGGTSRPFESLSILTNERPVIFYDQLGSGRSDRPSDTNLWRVPRFVEELKCVRRELGLRQFHLLGHSWGAMLAAEYMFTRPRGVRSLVLSSGAFNMRRANQDALRLVDELPPAVRETLRRHQGGGSDSEEYRQAEMVYFRQHMCRADPFPSELANFDQDFGHEVHRTLFGDGFIAANGVLKDYDATPRLHELRLPVLFTAGQYDDSTPAENAWYQGFVPGARLEIIEDAAHLIMLDNPRRYAEVVRSFLRDVED